MTLYGLDAMTGVLPVIVTAGVATKMTESMFDKTSPKARKRRTSRKRNMSRKRKPGNLSGNFSNIGF